MNYISGKMSSYLFPVRCACGAEIVIDIRSPKQELQEHLKACLGKIDYPKVKDTLITKIVPFSEITKEELECLDENFFQIDYKKRIVMIKMIG